MGGAQNKEIPHVHLPNNHGWIPNVIREYDLQKNKVLNEYKSIDRLGKGGYGTVLKVDLVIFAYIAYYIPYYIPCYSLFTYLSRFVVK
jgi:hypothetical protein